MNSAAARRSLRVADFVHRCSAARTASQGVPRTWGDNGVDRSFAEKGAGLGLRLCCVVLLMMPIISLQHCDSDRDAGGGAILDEFDRISGR